MNNTQFFIYLAIMAVTTYLIRVIPLVLVKEKITNRFLASFLYYIPYAVLTAITIPAIFTAASSPVAALAGFAVAVVLAFFKNNLTVVAVCSCLAVYLTGLLV